MIKALFFKYLLRKILLFSAMGAFSLLAVVGLDLTTYRQLTAQEQVMKVVVDELEEGRFNVKLISDSISREFELEGDQWQIDFRLIRFSPMVSITGLSYLYQPSRLSNRYVAIVLSLKSVTRLIGV